MLYRAFKTLLSVFEDEEEDDNNSFFYFSTKHS